MPNEIDSERRVRILIVEDEAIVAMDLKRRLEKQGFRVCGIADHCEEVLRMVEETSPDVVLMDIIIQGESDGIALAHQVREHYDLPIIFLTANSDSATIHRAKATVPYGFLIKPFEERELLATIEMGVYRHKLETEQRLYVRAIAASATSLLVTDARQPDNPIIFANPAFEQITGYSPAQVIGRNCRLLQGPGSDPQTVTIMREAIQAGSECRVTILNYRRDGTPIWIELLIAPVVNSAGQITHHVGVQKDVTVQKKADERIGELAALLDAAQDAIVVKGMDETILYWNKGAERICGWTEAEALGQNALNLVCPMDSKELEETGQQLLERGEWSGQLDITSKEGKTVQLETRWTLLRDENDIPKSKLIIGTDITAKKQLEAQVLRMQRMESIGTLAGGIAHDLNNVFGPILLGLEMLARQMPDKRSQHLLDLLTAASQRGAEIVKQILSFARGVEGERASVGLASLITEQGRICTSTFKKGIRITAETVTPLWSVMGDATQLHQVLMNLCVNAQDAMPDGGALAIKAVNTVLDAAACKLHPGVNPGPFVLITISDTGTGIQPAVAERIFDPFFTTKEVGKGTGLGLSTVLGIVKSHGGFIDVDSEVGVGTQFRVYLPAIADTDIQTAAPELIGTPQGDGECILLVDDEAAVRELTGAALEEHGYHVIVAADGTEAVVALSQNMSAIKAVVTDMSMPFMDGPTTIRVLRKMKPDLRFIAISGRLGTTGANELSQIPGVTFLQKPYTSSKLVHILRDCLN